jgi:hypothetical protein
MGKIAIPILNQTHAKTITITADDNTQAAKVDIQDR